jgi:class 3 adenylate cyclase/tetratricopeptide (TPR) repeat protein
MNCASCGQNNRADAAFCIACGQRLTRVCVSCSRELPAGARFCDACGRAVDSSEGDPRSYTPNHLAAKIITARQALEGERRQVTVLFADIVGSTATAEGLDPEEMHSIMDRCVRLLLEHVHRYEGTVNQFTGDGIMALFGAPIAHEDAPERAVHAALGMQAAVRQFGDALHEERGIEFRMRIGINTGLVVVGRIGDDLRMDYTAIGDTTNVAARLQTAAAPGAILISDSTAKLVTGRFVTRPLGPLLLKGKSQPVLAHEVVRALPRSPLVAPSTHGLTPLTARASELAALQNMFERVREGFGQVVFIVGEAGIGKSRLIHEFRTRLGGAVTWLQGRCISFGRGIPMLPVIDAMKGAFGIEESDDDPTIIAKIHAGVVALGLEEGDTVEPCLRLLLAVDPGDERLRAMDAIARRFATFDALKRFVLATAARQPLVLLVEDLHWIDPASDEFLTYTVDAVATARVLLLCTYRPGYRSNFGDRSYLNRLTLQALSPPEAAAMAAAMLDAADLPPEIRTLVAQKAEGNPFFIEEVIKSLLEVGALQRSEDGTLTARRVSETVIPNTIQDVIMARIDRLGEAPKRAIQVASVIGREFAVRLLQRASQLGDGVNQLVGELRALELIYEKFGVPELAYMFKHALTHEVAYESILVQRRKQLHHTIATAIEELYDDRLPEYWETLAHHFHRAEDWSKAFEYLVKAGDKARAAYANREAVHFYDRALEAGAHLNIGAAQRAEILQGKGWGHLCLSEFSESVEAYRLARELVTGAADRATIAALLGLALWYAHEFDLALEAADEALTLAATAGETRVEAEARCVVGIVRMVRGDLDGCAAVMQEAQRLVSMNQSPVFGPWIESSLALKASWQGDYAESLRLTEPLMAQLRSANQLWSLTQLGSHYAVTLGGAGEYERAMTLLREMITMAESIGDRFWRARMWNTLGWIQGELGAVDEAEEANHRSLEIARELGSLRMAPELIGNAEANLADLTLARADLDGAAAHLAAIAGILGDRRNEWMTWRYSMHYHLAAAELALARGDVRQARRDIEACLTTARRTRSRRYLVRSSRLLAGCHLADGDLVGAETLLASTVTAARDLGNPPQLWHALLSYGRVLHALGRRDDAASAWRQALAVIDDVCTRLPAEVQGTLRATPVTVALQELDA